MKIKSFLKNKCWILVVSPKWSRARLWRFNLWQFVFNHSRVMMKLAPDKQTLIVMDKASGVEWHAGNFFQAANVYRNGFEFRAKQISDHYMLNKVSPPGEFVVLDCGANNGDLLLALQGKDFRYIGIEPSPLEYRALSRNAADNEARNVGLMNRSGKLTFFVSSAGADSSFVRPVKFTEEIVVDAICADDLGLGEKMITLFKIDAEGCELEVLEGARNLLSKTRYITVDVGFERGIDEESTAPEVTNFLQSCGYSLVGVAKGRLVMLFENKQHPIAQD